MVAFLNKKSCKDYAITCSKELRGGKFTRVSADVYPWLNEVVRSTIENFVRSHPTLGKTLTAGLRKKE